MESCCSQERSTQPHRRRARRETRQLLPTNRRSSDGGSSAVGGGRASAARRVAKTSQQPRRQRSPALDPRLLLLILLAASRAPAVASFSVRAPPSAAVLPRRQANRGVPTKRDLPSRRPAPLSLVRPTIRLFASSSGVRDEGKSAESEDDRGGSPAAQRSSSAKEIRAELQRLGVAFHDCFDRESLAQRLDEARRRRSAEAGAAGGGASAGPPPPPSPGDEGAPPPSKGAPSDPPPSPATTVGTKLGDGDSTDLESIRAMSVKDLRSELASNNVRWQSFVDKSDLVRAVQQCRQEAARFSATGRLGPGRVGDLTDEQVKRELERPDPMLLDVYATWCGPCQLMAPILQQASTDLPSVRFAKMDSDKFPELSGRLGVQGLPTLVLFEGGAEVGRVEGALRKEQLVEWIQDKLSS